MSRTGRIIANATAVLGRNRLRTFFMMLGVFAGVTALTVLLALGQGTQREVLDRVNRMLSGSSIFLRAGGTQAAGGPHGGGPATTLTLADLEAIRHDVPGVRFADPMITTSRDVSVNGTSTETQIFGHSEASEIVWNRSVSRGSYFTADDVAGSARVALIGETLANELFGDASPVGEQIRIAGQPFQIIGVLELMGVDPHGIDRDRDLLIPISTMMRRVVNIDYIVAARIQMVENADLDIAVAEIGELLRQRHALSAGQPDDFAMFTPTQVQQVVSSTNRTFSVLLPIVAGVSLVIAALVVATLMLMMVNERRAEIGLRRAIGARARDIRLQILVEAAAITGFAGVLALAVSWGVLWFLGSHAISPGASLPWNVAGVGLVTAVGVGIAAGILPARKAAALDPARTLR